jgi:hypothetical protein
MKTLNLYHAYRIYLDEKKAFSVDSNGDEILVGLNRSESIEYIEATNGSISAPNPTNFNNPVRFLELSERHQLALPKEISPLYLKDSRFISS